VPNVSSALALLAANEMTGGMSTAASVAAYALDGGIPGKETISSLSTGRLMALIAVSGIALGAGVVVIAATMQASYARRPHGRPLQLEEFLVYKGVPFTVQLFRSRQGKPFWWLRTQLQGEEYVNSLSSHYAALERMRSLVATHGAQFTLARP
jgi:hypothetical protein